MNYRFEMPQHDARKRAMDSALFSPQRSWRAVSSTHKQDVLFVAEFIRKATTLPPKNDLERAIPQEVRLSREVALAFLSRRDFSELYTTRQLFLPENLAQDEEVVTEYCKVIPRALQQANSELSDNVNVVLSAVKRDGLELQYASQRLQSDEVVVRKACARNPLALNFCWFSSPTREKLFNDKEFLMKLFMKGGGELMRNVTSESLRNDPEMWLAAVTNGMMARYVPAHFDWQFWESAFSRDAQLYWQLSSIHKKVHSHRKELAYAACKARNINGKILEDMKNHVDCQAIFRLSDRTVAVAVARHAPFVEAFLAEHPLFYKDEEIMTLAVRQDPSLYNSIDLSLKTNHKILNAAITPKTAHSVLALLDNSWLEQHAEIAVAAVKITNELRMTANSIPEQVWAESRELASAWIQRGCRVLNIFASRLASDRELAMAVAAKTPLDYMKIGEDFRNDIEFVTEAVTKNGYILGFLEDPLKNDMELRVRAVSSYAGAVHPEFQKIRLRRHVTEKMDLYDMFKDLVLPGVHDPNSYLSYLNIDTETSTALKSRLAELLGVPVGSLLHIYRKCQANIRENHPARNPVEFFSHPTDYHQISNRLRIETLPAPQVLENNAVERHRAVMRLQEREFRALRRFEPLRAQPRAEPVENMEDVLADNEMAVFQAAMFDLMEEGDEMMADLP